MLSIRSSDFHAVAQEARAADKRIYTHMRAAIRVAGEDSVREIRGAIGGIPSSGKYGTGVRAALAAGTRVSIAVASPKSAGVSIVTSPTGLPANKRVLAKAMNLNTFAPTVYGQATRLQSGNPYFGETILRNRARMETAIWIALERAQREIAQASEKAGGNVG